MRISVRIYDTYQLFNKQHRIERVFKYNLYCLLASELYCSKRVRNMLYQVVCGKYCKRAIKSDVLLIIFNIHAIYFLISPFETSILKYLILFIFMEIFDVI